MYVHYYVSEQTTLTLRSRVLAAKTGVDVDTAAVSGGAVGAAASPDGGKVGLEALGGPDEADDVAGRSLPLGNHEGGHAGGAEAIDSRGGDGKVGGGEHRHD